MTAKKDDKPKRKAPVPIPVIGVRGSSTKISGLKTAAVAGAVSVALITPVAAATHPAVSGDTRDLQEGLLIAQARAKEIWDRHGTKILIGGGLVALFGAAFDRRFRDFPVRLGR